MSRDLDRLVGERLFGHTTVGKGPVGIDYDDCNESFNPVATADEEGFLYCQWCEDEQEYCNVHDLPVGAVETFGHGRFALTPYARYSEDIGACFAEVVPAMEGFDLELRKTGVLENTTWEAHFQNDYYGDALKKEGIAYESTPALAICLAALRAVGVTEEEMAL